jgi:hypothetical protein
MRRLVRLVQNAPHFLVDLDGRGLGVILMLSELAAEEDGLFLLAEGGRTEIGHAPLADHAPGETQSQSQTAQPQAPQPPEEPKPPKP